MKNARDRRLRELLAPHVEALYRAAYRLAGNRPDAEDLVQEVCVRACASAAELDTLDSVRGWLLKVQYRVFVDGVRRRDKSPLRFGAEDLDAVTPSGDPGPDDLLEGSLTASRILQGCAQLDKEQRALLALHVEGYSLAEIAAITDLSTEVLKARLYRARVRLGKLLAKNENAVLATES